MVETWVLWLFLVGLATGIVVALVVLVRLPRSEADVSVAERETEAAWISAIIERDGGVAPVSFVEEVLDLHQEYLRELRPPVPRGYVPGQAVAPEAPSGTQPAPVHAVPPGQLPRQPGPPSGPDGPSGPPGPPPGPPGPPPGSPVPPYHPGRPALPPASGPATSPPRR